jgi:hypothetical protein
MAYSGIGNDKVQQVVRLLKETDYPQSIIADFAGTSRVTVNAINRRFRIRERDGRTKIPLEPLPEEGAAHLFFVRPAGIEPATISLKGSRSTD